MIYSLILLNKPVINSDKNEKMGRVKGYVIDADKKSVIAFILAPDVDKGAVNAIPFENVQSIYDNAVIAQNINSAIPMADSPDILNVFLKDIAVIGSQVITDSGMLAGSVKDFAIDIKTGELAQISLVPENKDIVRIDSKHIIKITQSRIMVSAACLEEQPPEEPNTIELKPPPKKKPEVKTAEEKEVAAGEQPEKEQEIAEKPEIEETEYRDIQENIIEPESLSSDLKSTLNESFLEMTRILMGRLNSIDQSKTIAELSEKIDALSEKKEETADDESFDSTAGLILEEKIKRALENPIKSIQESIEKLKDTALSIKEIDFSEFKTPPTDMAPLQEKMSSIENRLSSSVDVIIDRIANIQTTDIDSINNSFLKLKSEIESIKSHVPSREDIRQQLGDINSVAEKRYVSIEKIIEAELDRHVESLREKIGSFPEIKDVDISADLDNFEKSMQCLFEDFRDQFASQLSVELDERSSENQSSLQNEIMERVKNELQPALDEIMKFKDKIPSVDSFEKISKDLVNTFSKKPAQELEPEYFKKLAEDIKKATEASKAYVSEEIANQLDVKLSKMGSDIKQSIADNFADLIGSYTSKLKELAGPDSSLSDEIEGINLKIENTLAEWVKNYSASSESIKSEISDLKNSVKDISVEKIREATAENADSVWKDLNRKLEALQASITDSFESRLVKRAEAEKASSEFLHNLIRQLDNHVIELREKYSIQESEISQTRKTVLDELRSYSDTTLKPEDLMIVHEWMREIFPEFSDKVSERIDAGLKPLIDGMQKTGKETGEVLENAFVKMRDHLAHGIELSQSELADINDIEQFKDRIEENFGSLVDGMVERIEERLDQRDSYYEEGVRSIINKVEKLLSRRNPDADGIFGGSGLISSIFSQRQEPPMKLTGKTGSRSRQSKPGSSEDAQLRRFAYLLGKKICRDITDDEGHVLAEEGAIVDEILIRRLRDKQKTLDLIRSVEFND